MTCDFYQINMKDKIQPDYNPRLISKEKQNTEEYDYQKFSCGIKDDLIDYYHVYGVQSYLDTLHELIWYTKLSKY